MVRKWKINLWYAWIIYNRSTVSFEKKAIFSGGFVFVMDGFNTYVFIFYSGKMSGFVIKFI